MPVTHRRRALAAGLLACALPLACSPSPDAAPEARATREHEAAPEPEKPRFEVTAPSTETAVLPTSDAATATLATSAALFAAAPVAVLGPVTDPAAQRQAVDLGAPLLPTEAAPSALVDEATRLAAEALLAVGPVPEPVTAALDAAGVPVVTGDAELPETSPGAGLPGVVVLTDGQPWAAGAAAVAEAAGARVRTLPEGDPRTAPETIDALSADPPTHVLALGDVFGAPDVLAQRVDVAETGVQLPGGGQVLLPHRRLVALYGHPGAGSLGVLGEQDVEKAVARAKEVAAQYEPFSSAPVVPAFEIITTIASSAAGSDGDYSTESDVEKIRPWVDAAREAGLYVLLDLQPGRADFLTQAKRYEELLLEPHVGLALDPEWRLEPDQRHMRQIGSVDAEEVNAVADWLAGLTREHRLPQKALVVHQFRLSMIEGRENLDASHDELAVILHADGNGTPEEKLATWNALRRSAPDGVFWAWKNFYDEDRPTFTPQQTMELEPAPLLVTYQ